MNHPTLARVRKMDKWVRLQVDRDMVGSKMAVYNPTEGIIYLSQAMKDLLDEGQILEKDILCVDLGNIPMRREVAV